MEHRYTNGKNPIVGVHETLAAAIAWRSTEPGAAGAPIYRWDAEPYPDVRGGLLMSGPTPIAEDAG